MCSWTFLDTLPRTGTMLRALQYPSKFTSMVGILGRPSSSSSLEFSFSEAWLSSDISPPSSSTAGCFLLLTSIVHMVPSDSASASAAALTSTLTGDIAAPECFFFFLFFFFLGLGLAREGTARGSLSLLCALPLLELGKEVGTSAAAAAAGATEPSRGGVRL
eukprot:CAMPEP_0171773950 /NCGR_PEP_ID=MMETSP0991-20121206/55597_1 /TAXON_ID=483369 /ORGANISM="non described non described, Strain CCMP2098" /LENGTH=161 /DNA_ID=CAMNT_0012379783 /DNA_START=89 /DNA_END=574 /DNA_ORIENTATION=-